MRENGLGSSNSVINGATEGAAGIRAREANTSYIVTIYGVSRKSPCRVEFNRISRKFIIDAFLRIFLPRYDRIGDNARRNYNYCLSRGIVKPRSFFGNFLSNLTNTISLARYEHTFFQICCARELREIIRTSSIRWKFRTVRKLIRSSFFCTIMLEKCSEIFSYSFLIEESLFSFERVKFNKIIRSSFARPCFIDSVAR